MQTQLAAPIDAARWGLLHDAAETYLMDVPTPFKPNIPLYDAWETYVLQRVAEAFDLCFPIPEIVWEADQLCLTL